MKSIEVPKSVPGYKSGLTFHRDDTFALPWSVASPDIRERVSKLHVAYEFLLSIPRQLVSFTTVEDG